MLGAKHTQRKAQLKRLQDEVVDIEDGNNHDQLRHAFDAPFHGKPKCIIARTIKGKGISFMENNLLWHYRDPQGEFYDRAIAELEAHRL